MRLPSRRRGYLGFPANLRLARGRRGHFRFPAILGLSASLGLAALGAQALGAQSAGAVRRLEIAIADVDSAGTVCMRGGGALPPSARVWLVQPDTPQSLAEAVPGSGPCVRRRPDAAQERLLPLRVLGGALDSTRLSIAIVGAHERPVLRGGLASADLDGDGTPERFRACTSAEGVHLTIWSGRPPTERLRWHRYYYLGYDVEPSCTAAEVRDPVPGTALGGAGPGSG